MMARTALPLGFRFHPTDVELVMYHLKKKVMGKNVPFDVISELNIYNYSPWDLPDKSCLRSKVREWYFFCPKERKFPYGPEKRSTDCGYWKSTGKDRLVSYNDRTVAMVKTLVFYKGNAPRGERTDWVMYEYRMVDKELSDAGVVQDAYVLCKVFHKNGPGPKSDAQYGATFNEDDYDDNDFPTPDKQDLSMPDPNSKGERDSGHLQLQLHQYSDATVSMSDRGSTSGGNAPEEVALKEWSDYPIEDWLSNFTSEELLEEISWVELVKISAEEEEVSSEESEEISSEESEEISSEESEEISSEESEEISSEESEEISSEESEETPSPREIEDLIGLPMEFPPILSHDDFSIFQVLDLSYTEIKSLPQSISRLASLQKLILRSCALLMMKLPPEIGELTNLELLDLEGTEILCLPKEIVKLVNLTCLKVSFYGYANQIVIPRRVLSNLSRLNKLIIDVTPYGEWWDVEVDAIVDDLRSLKELRTLKLYLPTAELLEKLISIFPGLAKFRFTVGRNEEHFISWLPHDVEEEFNNWEKLKKGLKYVNGDHMPNEITKVFKHVNAFYLQRHWTAESLSEFGHGNMNEVKVCLVMECNEFRTIIDSEKLYQGKDGRAESEDFPNFNEAMVLGSLERLIVRYMKNMESIWKGPVGKGSLSNLKSLALHTCPNLTALFTIDMLSNLINLEELIVEDCPKINSLVSLENSCSESVLFLKSLKKISLLLLPGLITISSGQEIAPKLERMVIYYCPKLEKLSTVEVSSTELKVIKGEKEWWDALKWYESDVSTEREDYLARHFIPLRRDGDLIAQLTKD